MKNTTEWSYIDKWAKKIRAINYLGKKCNKCGNDNIFALSFHHLSNKNFLIMDKYHKWSDIVKEIDNCELLCQNCHQELHIFDEIKDDSYRKSKEIYLEYKGKKCECCGYDKNNGCLVFHHKNEKDKLFTISDYPIRNLKSLDNYIKNEIDKCEVLCQNCHTEHHTDIDKFNLLKEKIYHKVYNFKENKPYLQKDEVYKMLDSGTSQKDIAIYFNSSKTTISMIIKNRNNILIKNNKINNSIKPTYSELLLESKIKSQRELAREYNVTRNMIRKWLKLL